jgi:hypothetical protein
LRDCASGDVEWTGTTCHNVLHLATLAAMPKRSNLFQDVVGLVTRHLAGETANVVESEMLVSSATGRRREVDVVVHQRVAGIEVLIGVEAKMSSRPETVEWVERMLGKHEHLPTNRLVLYSDSGFTADAKDLAQRKGVIVVQSEDLDDDELARVIARNLGSVWLKSITPGHFQVTVTNDTPAGAMRVDSLAPETPVWLADGSMFMTLDGLFALLLHEGLETFKKSEVMRDIEEDRNDLPIYFPFEPFEPRNSKGQLVPYFLRSTRDGDDGQLQRITGITMRGEAAVKVQEIVLRHVRLGDVVTSYGEYDTGDAKVIVTNTVVAGEEVFAIRTRGADGATVTNSSWDIPQ